MTRFIYISDTHMGADEVKLRQQGYPEHIAEILMALKTYLHGQGDIDFVLHGGDMINTLSDAGIIAAVTAFDWGVPVHLCLGNHDLDAPNAVERWLALSPGFFGDSGKPMYTVATEDCRIHVVPNHWCEEPYYWRDSLDSQFSTDQLAYLTEALDSEPDLPHIVQTHSPVFEVPEGQTVLAEPLDPAASAFTAAFMELVSRHPNLKCVLGGHNHMNIHVVHEGVHFVTSSALVEVPFEFKVIEVAPGAMAMSTVSLNDSLRFDAVYDAEKAYVQGRESDRSFADEF
tara:strand:+ start:1631 stop:2488 length:858 start_codon:yes stop_codon:yes gene_type:complete